MRARVRRGPASRALHALAEMPGGAAVAGLLQRWAKDTGVAPTQASIKKILETVEADGRTLDAHIHEALLIALAAHPSEAPLLGRTLSSLAIMRALSTRSSLGCEWDPVLSRGEAIAIAEATTTASDPIPELEATVLDLRLAGLIVMRKDNHAPTNPPWEAIGPYHFFFCRTDALFQRWDPQADAKEICRQARRTRVLNSAELDMELHWGPRRLNSAVACAELRCWIKAPYRRGRGDQYILPCAYLTENGRRSAETGR